MSGARSERPMSSPSHRDLILDQFSRQAVPFSTAPGIKDEQALRLIVDATGAGPADTVLDVACGGGIVVCAFARVVRHATGIDLTPAMLERARAYAAEQGLTNVSWKQGDVLPLPYPDGSFSLVTSRFAFHHFLDPEAVLAEMKRVCAPGGGSRSSTARPRPIPPRPPSSTAWRSCATPPTCAPCRSRSSRGCSTGPGCPRRA